MIKLIRIFIYVFTFSSAIQASDLSGLGASARSLAMGGTGITTVKGASALYYNPAALARMEGFDFVVAEVNAAYSKDAVSLIKQMTNSGSSNLTAADLNNLYGLNVFADVTARSGIAMPYFGFGVYSTNNVLESFNTPPFPTFHADFISDYGYVVAGAFAIGPQTSIGIAGRHIARWGGSKDILVTDLLGSNTKAVLQSAFQDKGNGDAIDLSFMTTLPGDLTPTIAVTWQDVGRTTFSKTSGTQAPPSQGENLTLGASIQHEALFAHWTHAFEYKYINTPNENITKKIHFGTEMSYGLFDVRAGFGQGYLSYGGGVDLWFLTADVAYYTAELGTTAGQQRNDRVIYSLNIEFDFDQTFKILDSEGKKRRLKQRR